MEEITNQTIEAPREEKQETEGKQKTDKLINTVMIVVLILIILLLGIFIGYQFLKKNSGSAAGNVTTTSEKTTQEPAAPQNNGEINEQTTPGPQTGATAAVKADIDKDLETLDKLDLSGIENDYGEDQLSDL